MHCKACLGMTFLLCVWVVGLSPERGKIIVSSIARWLPLGSNPIEKGNTELLDGTLGQPLNWFRRFKLLDLLTTGLWMSGKVLGSHRKILTKRDDWQFMNVCNFVECLKGISCLWNALLDMLAMNHLCNCFVWVLRAWCFKNIQVVSYAYFILSNKYFLVTGNPKNIPFYHCVVYSF